LISQCVRPRVARDQAAATGCRPWSARSARIHAAT
jgi:hypothetical protein